MTDRDNNNEIVEIDFEVGHVSIIRPEPTTIHNPPRTHDWRVYLRSTDVHGDLNCLIQRCVFYLHPEFPNSKRELKSTPFAIHETGYAGFHLLIDIYFKTKKEPKKFRIEYDLDLHTNVDGHPQRQKESYVRKYRCTFYNPDPELRQKILSAGGRIKDAHPISTHHNENDESNTAEEPIPTISEPVVRHSPPQKRTFSPVPTNPSGTIKKVKVEQAIANPKKKQQQQTSSVTKNETSTKPISNTINIKKSQLTLTTKPSPITDEKSTKTTNQTISNTNPIVDDSSSTKILPKIKIKSDPDSKPVLNPIPKKKEPLPSPSKPINQQMSIKKPTPILSTKPAQKLSIKLESTSTVNKSPSNVNIKRESSPIANTSNSNSTNPTALISRLKKIPKKVLPPPPPPPTVEKQRARSPMTPPPPPPPNRNSDRDSHRHQSSSSKSQSSSKRDRPITPPLSNHNSTSRRNSSSNRSGKHSTTNSSNRARSRSRSRSRSHSRNCSSHPTHHNSRSHHSSSSSRHSSQQKDRSSHHESKSSSRHTNRRTPTPPKSTRTSPSRANQSHSDLPPTSIHTPQSRPDSVEPTTVSSPSAQVFPSEDDHTQTPMDIDGQSDDDRRLPLSDEHEQTSPLSSAFPSQSRRNISNRNFQSDHSYSSSDLNESNDESNQSLNDDDDDEENLPTVLTDDDLRSKLIFIYKRFKLNSSNDLSIFVTFFKRHHFIDISSKTNNDMFTYDLFSLEPLLIDELATDLGYTNSSLINRTEQ